MIERGEIYWINLDPTLGAEIKKTRPALIVSNNQNNQYAPLVTILPITSNAKKIYPFEVALPSGKGGLKHSGKIKANQIRTIDKRRIAGGPIGPPLDDGLMHLVEKAIKIHLGIE